MAEKNRLFMQTVADVTGRTIQVARSAQTPAVGSAIFGAVAAGKAKGGWDTVEDAAKAMGGLKDLAFTPNPATKAVYDRLFAEYRTLHDYFGKANPVMKTLKALRQGA